MDEQIELLRFLLKSCEREGLANFNNLLKELKITANQAEVLTVLDTYGPMSIKNLGQLLICERQSPSRLVSSVINKGLARTIPYQKDKRVNLVQLSSAGQQLIPILRQKNAEFNASIKQKIKNPEQITELIKILSFYLKNTESYAKLAHRFENL
ncbi:MarR family winged helix-turn-helix transcriptional regulator [Bombilactobacillus thymidiniphilus]|uniref:Winged helix DNA-binding protein n=1 Tax=Bombilactobacillus thymidiniphilus TaxID=2923363 RepID=A0ABY4PCD9_9LACO|nr:winged helix DNA-binding protein [Bombilactobacillus thymidiniphilus]UQS83333.1 winged helix DNA-binding protein [Bombilactobacillus thymidiniphilus]